MQCIFPENFGGVKVSIHLSIFIIFFIFYFILVEAAFFFVFFFNVEFLPKNYSGDRSFHSVLEIKFQFHCLK